MAFNTGNAVPSANAKDLNDNAENLDSSVNTQELTWTDRLGVVRDTVHGRITKMGFTVPTAYVSGIVFSASDNVKTVEEAGVVYAALPSALPFTTTNFAADSAKFFVVQGASSDLKVPAIYDTVALFETSLVEYKDGKTILISATGAKYTKITGTVSGDGFNIVASTSLDQSIQQTDYRYTGVVDIPSSVTITSKMNFDKAALRPASGVVVTITNSVVVSSNCNWMDVSLGGSFVINDGAWEERTLTKITNPTGGYVINRGSPANIIDEESGTSFVNGGTRSSPHTLGAGSQLCLIGAGYDNSIGAGGSPQGTQAATIAGGAHNEIKADASHGSVLGGSYQVVHVDYATACGGISNEVASTFSFNGGGQGNKVGDLTNVAIDYRSAFNGAGALNEVYAMRSVNGGGLSNLVQETATEAFNGAGLNNDVSGTAAFNGAGGANKVYGNEAANIAGTGNESTGTDSLTHGSSCKASGNQSIAIGEFLEATASSSSAWGARSKAVLRGQRALASGYFSSKGDAQISDLVARRQTVGAQLLNLDLNGAASEPIQLPDNTAWMFKVSVVARRTDVNGEHAMYTFAGGIYRDTGVATTALMAAATKTVVFESDAGLDVTLVADAALGMKISVTGVAAKTFNWVARIELVEVAG